MKQRPFKFGPMWQVQMQGPDGLSARTHDGLFVIASWGLGWDHVSVSRSGRCPDWEEMCRVKDAFFEPEECVIQFHPPKSRYVNMHPFCLHLWRPQNVELPMPDPLMVGWNPRRMLFGIEGHGRGE